MEDYFGYTRTLSADWLEDGGLRIEVADCDDHEFGGRDRWQWCEFGREDAVKLYNLMDSLQGGRPFKDALIAQFGPTLECFSMARFQSFCKERGIAFVGRESSSY